ncbi:hypothetical protein, partial [Klebsiella pneumoniae]|uniref:hypothetical protein n=1 Tax=Klebsiella pneumoniae TaxID=573 RepID=UPI003531BBB2
MLINLNMLGSTVENGVEGDVNGTLIVNQHTRLSNRKRKFSKKVSKPSSISGASSHCPVFNLCAR